jgi:hypothetical protein
MQLRQAHISKQLQTATDPARRAVLAAQLAKGKEWIQQRMRGVKQRPLTKRLTKLQREYSEHVKKQVAVKEPAGQRLLFRPGEAPKVTEAVRQAAEPSKVMSFIDARAKKALEGIQTARDKAVETLNKAVKAGETNPAKLTRTWDKALKPAVEEYSYWRNQLKSGAKRIREQKTAEAIGTGARPAAHAKTLRRAAAEARSLGAAPPAYEEPLKLAYPTRGEILKQVSAPVNEARLKAVIKRAIPQQTQPGLMAKLARGIVRERDMRQLISQRARTLKWSDARLQAAFKKAGWEGAIAKAPESALADVLQTMRRKLAPTAAAGQTYRTPGRTLEKLGLGKEARALELANLRAAAEKDALVSRFRPVVAAARKEAGSDAGLWKQVLGKEPAGPAVKQLQKQWRTVEQQTVWRKGVPIETRIKGYWPQMKKGQKTLITERGRKGFLPIEKRAPLGESMDQYFAEATKIKHVRPALKTIESGLRSKGFVSVPYGHQAERFTGPWASVGEEVTAALRGRIAGGPAVKAQRAAAGVAYAGLLSAPSSAGINMTQLMNLGAEEGLSALPRALMKRALGKSYKSLAKRWGVGARERGIVGEFLPKGETVPGRLLAKGERGATALFRASERAVKSLDFQAAYGALRKRGLPHDQAARQALLGVGRRQFWGGPAGRPMFAQKYPMPGQFMTYPIRQATLMKDWIVHRPAAAIRYGVQLQGIATILRKAGISPNPVAPFAFQAPSRVGPVAEPIAGVLTAGWSAATGKSEQAKEELRRAGVKGLSLLRPYRMVQKALQEMEGKVLSPQTGKPRYIETTATPKPTRIYRALLYAMGATPEAHAKLLRAEQMARTEREEERKGRQAYTRALYDVLSSGAPKAQRDTAVRELWMQAYDKNMAPTPEGIEALMRRMEQSALEYELQRAPLHLKARRAVREGK